MRPLGLLFFLFLLFVSVPFLVERFAVSLHAHPRKARRYKAVALAGLLVTVLGLLASLYVAKKVIKLAGSHDTTDLILFADMLLWCGLFPPALATFFLAFCLQGLHAFSRILIIVAAYLLISAACLLGILSVYFTLHPLHIGF